MLQKLCLCIINHDKTIALFHCYIYTLLKAFFIFCIDSKFIYHYLNIVVLISIHLHSSGYFGNNTVNAHVKITFTSHTFEKFSIMTFTTSYQWGEYENTLVVVIFKNHIQDLLFCIFYHLLTSRITVGSTGTCKQKSHVIIYFRYSSDRRTGVLICRLLFYAYDGAQTCNLIYIRPFKAAEKIACVCRKGFDISALPFGKNCIKGKR